jgi:hypothetical protein
MSTMTAIDPRATARHRPARPDAGSSPHCRLVCRDENGSPRIPCAAPVVDPSALPGGNAPGRIGIDFRSSCHSMIAITVIDHGAAGPSLRYD